MPGNSWRFKTRCQRCRALNITQDEGADHCYANAPCGPCEEANAPCFTLPFREAVPLMNVTMRMRPTRFDIQGRSDLRLKKPKRMGKEESNKMVGDVADQLSACPSSLLQWGLVEAADEIEVPPTLVESANHACSLLHGLLILKCPRLSYEEGKEFPDIVMMQDNRPASVARRALLRERLLDKLGIVEE
ncbi:hypothetical protein BC829DRAFT_394687 [Chytridium lagenaria]|nr:hypothetical protein BC829DRAFT_394687 [Chytridium lagenaria]